MTDAAMIGAPRYEREPNDFYETPAWVTRALWRNIHVPTQATIWEPAAGRGAIAKAWEGPNPWLMSDINPMAADVLLLDFLSINLTPDGSIGAIITNPPFKILDAFARHALSFGQENNIPVALLARNEWDCAKGRADLIDQLAMKVVLRKRPIWFPDREQRASPRHNYAWYIWRPGHVGPAQIVYEGDER